MIDKNKPLFSVLIANYNNAKYFKRCFDSISQQTYDNFEAIIIDDCSTEQNEIETLKEIIKHDDRFTLITLDKNHGCGSVKRKLVKLSKGEICGFVDPDDFLHVDALKMSVEAHLSNPDISVTYSNHLRFTDENNLSLNNMFVRQQIKDDESMISFEKRYTNHAFHFATFKKKLYRKTEGINSYLRRSVDYDMFLKLEEVGKFLHINEVLYYYREHDSNISLNENRNKTIAMVMASIYEAGKRRGINVEQNMVDYLKFKQDSVS